ncbi:hypothetical protein [Ruminococcus sp.]|uniref:hypothetical protein n=1 Tax=Ruminococcus sp. TaxID=41978 RepID=UPI0025FD366E|nr:hypothetical protein [Ruminococcus sp.]
MKANFKMTLTAIAATVICAVPMISMIANADAYQKGNKIVIENEEFKPMGTTPSQDFIPRQTTIILTKLPPNTWTKPYTKIPPKTELPPITWIDPLTDPIKDDYKFKDHFYMTSNIKTTTVEVAKNIR